MSNCELCQVVGGELLLEDERVRVVLVDDPLYPGFCRVIWQQHVKEMTDLSSVDRAYCMQVVFAVESAVRTLLSPDKMNVASLGNMTPHVHWHIIPRFVDDPHFPAPVWGVQQRMTPVPIHVDVAQLRASILQQLREST